jgi:hypothetical protein
MLSRWLAALLPAEHAVPWVASIARRVRWVAVLASASLAGLYGAPIVVALAELDDVDGPVLPPPTWCGAVSTAALAGVLIWLVLRARSEVTSSLILTLGSVIAAALNAGLSFALISVGALLSTHDPLSALAGSFVTGIVATVLGLIPAVPLGMTFALCLQPIVLAPRFATERASLFAVPLVVAGSGAYCAAGAALLLRLDPAAAGVAEMAAAVIAASLAAIVGAAGAIAFRMRFIERVRRGDAPAPWSAAAVRPARRTQPGARASDLLRRCPLQAR